MRSLWVAAHKTRNLRYKKTKTISVLFHYGSTSYYSFIFKELVKGFEGQFECLGENAEKYIAFSITIKR